MPSASATWTGSGASHSVDVLEGQPGISDGATRGLGVQFHRRLVGILPSLSVSAAPAMDGRELMRSSRRFELGHATSPCLSKTTSRSMSRTSASGLRALDDVAHHPRTLLELDHGDRIRRVFLETPRGPGVDQIGVQLARPWQRTTRGSRGARRADRPRVKEGPPAVGAPLDAQLAGCAAVPERLGLGGRHRDRLGSSCPSRPLPSYRAPNGPGIPPPAGYHGHPFAKPCHRAHQP